MELKKALKYCYEYAFWHQPLILGIVELLQVGELQSEWAYEVDEHVQLCHEIFYVTSGGGESWVDGKMYPIKQGDLCITRKGEMHKVIASSSEGLHYFYLGFNLLEDSKGRENLFNFYNSHGNPRQVKNATEVLVPFNMLMEEMSYQADMYQDVISSLILQIIVMTYRKSLHMKQSRLAMNEVSVSCCGTSIYGILRYVDKNIDNLDGMHKMASDLGYSYNYLSHLFKEKVGITLREYINNKKIEHSLSLIDSNRFSLTRIANILNYKTIQSFSKAFKRVMHMSPSVYKQMQLNKSEKERAV